jgi:single-stranded-DNA-specific exonuclease
MQTENLESTSSKVIKTKELERESENLAKIISHELKLHHLTAELLCMRGIKSSEEAKAFLNPTLRQDLPNPRLLKNSELVVSRIIQAIKNKEYITIFSDFDVDGMTSGSQLYLILANAGAKLRYYVPDREKEGYGLSTYAVEKLAKEKTDLLITLDCGTSNIKEIALAKSLGLSVIVIDHHELGDHLPPADIMINPHQEGCEFKEAKLATAGIIWLVGIILLKELENLKDDLKLDFPKLPTSKSLLDLAAIGTICDMVPLKGVNRLIAHKGIESIRSSMRPGIEAVVEIAGLPQGKRFACSHIAFGIGPRLNASGRIDSATLGFSLLTSESIDESKKIARTVQNLNQERKALETHAKEVCFSEIEEILENPENDQFAYAIYDPSFHVGIIGIAAQRVVEKFHRPTAVMTLVESEGKRLVKGSVRSVGGFHVADALKSLSHLLINHGGHAEAGGFSLLEENLDALQKEFPLTAKEFFGNILPQKIVKVDRNIKFSEITIQLVQELHLLAPFGMGNSSPSFVTENVEILSVQMIGESHIKLELKDSTAVRTAIGWRMRGIPSLFRGNTIDIVYSLELNTYKGVTSVQLIAKEVFDTNSLKKENSIC